MVEKKRFGSYREVLDFLFSSLPMYQRTGSAAYKIDLEVTHTMDAYFHHPHNKYPSIHIAGTNGKGSVSHMMASVLQEAGYRTGLYTSPHLKDFRERIRINGQPVPEAYVKSFVKEHDHLFDKLEPSFFEITVAMAFRYFADEKVDVAVIETGLGGRLDSTNIITPVCSVITNIGLDHTRFLGNTIEHIAREKAGIIKPGIPVVIGRYQEETAPVFRKTAAHNRAEIHFAGKELNIDYSMYAPDGKQIFNVKKDKEIYLSSLHTDLLGTYQKENILTALRTLEIIKKDLPAEEEHLRSGFLNVSGNTGLMGRWQVLQQHPFTVCDTGHNRDAFVQLNHQIRNTPYRELYMVLGFVSDKDPAGILQLLPRQAQYLFTKAAIPRAMDPEEVRQVAAQYGLKGRSFPTVAEAVEEAFTLAGKNDMIFIGGSTFVVAEVI